MNRLVGRRLPTLSLPSTQGGTVNLSLVPGHLVLFCYPYTGRPGVPDPEGWDDIPGAHGSTPQAIGYSRLYDSFLNQGVKVFGISLQEAEWQSEFARRNALKVPLLSDQSRLFSVSLSLRVFQAGGRTFLKRLTILARDGTIIGAHEPRNPEHDAAETLALFGAS